MKKFIIILNIFQGDEIIWRLKRNVNFQMIQRSLAKLVNFLSGLSNLTKVNDNPDIFYLKEKVSYIEYD